MIARLLNRRRRFHGGVRLDDHKTGSLRQPIERAPLPPRLQVQLRQHIGGANEPQVEIGQRVLKGQMLATASGMVSAPVHAPTSGRVTEIGAMPVPHLSGLPARCVVIESDGDDEWTARNQHTGYRVLSPRAIIEILHESGLVGLGGALFPTAVKLTPQQRAADTLIVNAAECEPYISCDQALMNERAEDIVRGIEIAKYALEAGRALIGIEDNKPDAIAALKAALSTSNEQVELVVVPTRYPAGGERQLVQMLTGREAPAGGLPADIGVRVINIATAYAACRAVCFGEPLISRIVTVTGDGVANPRNLEVLIGAPIAELIDYCGGYTEGVQQLTMGGPMMGFALPDDALPVIKSTNCLIASTTNPGNQLNERPCIRCGHCTDVCPANLLPQQLYWYAKARDLPKVLSYNIADCIECGACAYVCPSRIPLVQYYRYAKSEIDEEACKREQSEAARLRFEAREARLEAIKREKAEKMAKKRAALEASKKAKLKSAVDKKDVIAAALARVQAKKAAADETARNTDSLNAAQQRQIAEADARRTRLKTDTDDDAI